MAEWVVSAGSDTWVNENKPDLTRADNKFPIVMAASGARRRVFLKMAPGVSTGATVLSAVLSVPVRGSWPAQTLSVQALNRSWAAKSTKWSDQPGVTGPVVTKTTGALADGQRIEIDVTALVQQVANGAPFYGWRIITDRTASYSKLYGFDAGVPSWQLRVEVSDAPSAPSTLVPNGGIVSAAKPLLGFDFTDYYGETEMAAFQVRVDDNKAAPFVFDSGEVAATLPEVDLASTAYAGMGAGASAYWQVRVKDTAGIWSEWSDWAVMTRQAKPTATLLNPSSGSLSDSSPMISAQLGSGLIQAYRVVIYRADDPANVRYDSGRTRMVTPAARVDHQVPFRDPGTKKVVLRGAGPWVVQVRLWDRNDRQFDGTPPYLEVSRTVTLDTSAAVTAPSSLSAVSTSDGLGVWLRWARSTAPDRFEVRRDGIPVAQFDQADLLVSAGVWEWQDYTAPPNTTSTYTVRAITSWVTSQDSPTASSMNRLDGVWLVRDPENGAGAVCLSEAGIDGLRVSDRRATFELPYRPDAVDVIGALGGLSGSFEGVLPGSEDEVRAAKTILSRIRRAPEQPVQLIYGTTSVPVLLRHLSVTPDPMMLPDLDRFTHRVSFECWQVDDFDLGV